MLLDALIGDGGNQGIGTYRPQRLQVTDSEAQRILQESLGDLDIEVELVEQTPAVDEVMGQMTQRLAPNLPPPIVGQGDVTPERLRAFAQAASEFYRAAPWQ